MHMKFPANLIAVFCVLTGVNLLYAQDAPVRNEATAVETMPQEEGAELPAAETGDSPEAANEQTPTRESAQDSPEAGGKTTTPSPETQSDAPEATPAPKPAPKHVVYETVQDALGNLAAEGLLDPDSDTATNRVLDALTDAFGVGVKYLPPASDVDSRGTGAAPLDGLPEPTIRVTNKTIGYFRVLDFNDRNEEKINVFAALVSDGAYEGVILDLRYAGGDKIAMANAVAEQFLKTDAPFVLLVNRETAAASEVLVHRLKSRQKTLLMGQPTSGMPFTRKELLLSNGGILLVPDRNTPGAEGLWPPSPIEPDITIETMLEQDVLDAIDGMEINVFRLGRDKTLRRAVDLLTVVQGLAHKHF